GEGIAAGVLESVGVNLDKVRAQVMSLIAQSNLEPGPEKDAWVWPPALLMREDRLSDAAREVLESSAAIAHSLNHSTVGTEHLLRALIASSESAAARVLHSFDGLAGRINVILDMILVPAEGKETPGPLAYDIWLAEALLNASRLWRVERVGQISTAFLLFAITSQAGGKGAHVLNALGVDSEVLRRALTESD
ncbi:MAG: hypothetical protein M3Y37_02170, partial [Chloroflexota bacterium]|nr:hypothetical protein [Chloroflexota bacterium]